MSALPVYVNLPEFYGRGLHLQIAGIGLMFLLTRALDAIQDPLLGLWSDRMAAQGRGGRTRMIVWSAPVICLGQWLLFHPPAALLASGWIWLWLGGALMITYFGFSAATISYLALAADLHRDPDQRTRLAGAREGIGLIGVMVAAATPALLTDRLGQVGAYQWFSDALIPALLLGALVTVLSGRRRLAELPPVPSAPPLPWRAAIAQLLAPLAARRFLLLLGVFVLSGTASSIPVNLVQFFIRDVIGGQARDAGIYLLSYFLAGALGMPVWVALAVRLGKIRAWACAMLLTLAALGWAFFLRQGDGTSYLAVCVLAGLAFGGDIALPPALLSDVVDLEAADRTARPGKADGADTAGQGGYLGIWTLVSKLNLAFAAGLSLPLLGWLGYVPGAPMQPQTITLLAGTYALLPCVLKAGALGLLLRSRRALTGAARPVSLGS